MKNLIRIIWTAIVLPSQIFAIHPILNDANKAYKNEEYMRAYKIYMHYLYSYGNQKEIENYYIALIGSHCCLKHIETKDAYEFYKYYIMVMNYVNISDEEKVLRDYILENSIYFIDQQQQIEDESK